MDAVSMCIVGREKEFYIVKCGHHLLYRLDRFSDALQYAIDSAGRAGGGVVAVEPGEYTVEHSVEPRDKVIVDFGWSRIRLARGVKNLFYKDFRGSHGLWGFAVRRLIAIGNRCELASPGRDQRDVVVNREEPFLIRLSNLDGGGDITVEDLVLRDYYGGPLGVTLCPSKTCRSSRGEEEPRPLVGLRVRRVKGYNASTVFPDVRRHYGKRPYSALDSVYNVVIEDLELRNDVIVYEELYRFRHRVGVRGCVNLVARNIYAEKATDGPLILLESCRNVMVENVVTYRQHDYAVDIVGGRNIVVNNVSVMEPRNWGAVLVQIVESPLNYVANIIVQNVVVSKPVKLKAYPAICVRDNTKHAKAVIKNIIVRNVAVDRMEAALKVKAKTDSTAGLSLENVHNIGGPDVKLE